MFSHFRSWRSVIWIFNLIHTYTYYSTSWKCEVDFFQHSTVSPWCTKKGFLFLFLFWEEAFIKFPFQYNLFILHFFYFFHDHIFSVFLSLSLSLSLLYIYIFIYDRNFDHFVFTSWINWLLSQLYGAGLYACLLIEHIISLPPHPVLIVICLIALIHGQPINWWCVASRAITYMMCCKRQQRQFVSQLLWLPCQALLFYCC